jgi:phage shock protein B
MMSSSAYSRPDNFHRVALALIFHYMTKWKTSATLTREDENLLDELHDTARRLDDRLETIERILTADNPNWKAGELGAPAPRIDHRH